MRRFLDFFKDKLIYTIGFIVITIVFSTYLITIPGSKNIPLLMLITAFLVYAAVMTVEYIKYLRYIEELSVFKSNRGHEIITNTSDQKITVDIIEDIFKDYEKEFNRQQHKGEKNREIIGKCLQMVKETVMSMMVTLNDLSQLTLPKDAYHYLEDLRADNDRAGNDIKQILEIIRLEETEDVESSKELYEVNLTDQIKYIVENNKRSFSYNGVYPEVDGPDEEVFIYTEPKLNILLIRHILSNAVKFSCLAGENKKIGFAIIPEQHETILEIIDEGIGIPATDMDEIFLPFFKGENGNFYSDASGLGLYICRNIADKLGHQLEIESEQGVGTTVRIKYRPVL